jgi:pyruvate kinase
MQIISKVESNTALENLDDIIKYSDGIMVARGDLGVEVPMQELPIIQKKIIEKCRKAGKFCIVATEMLASMYKNARPTRAEVTDIANAVLDGTDAVMLSGETTTGKYPIDAVKYMSEIVENTEKYLDYNNIEKPQYEAGITDTIANSVVDASNMLDVKAIVAATLSGYTACKISNLRPKTIIVAACPTTNVALSLSLRFGVYATLLPVYDSTDELVEEAINKTKEIVKLKEKDLIVITGGFPNNGPIKTTNFLKIERI